MKADDLTFWIERGWLFDEHKRCPACQGWEWDFEGRDLFCQVCAGTGLQVITTGGKPARYFDLTEQTDT